MKICTIGFSKKSAEEFFSILSNAGVEKLLDVRLNNKSQLLGFSKGRDLEYFCTKCHGIEYEHVPLLAPTKDILKKYQMDKDWASYENQFVRLLESRPVVDIFTRACGGAETVCLLCSEPTAETCHRRLVAEHVAGQVTDAEVVHL